MSDFKTPILEKFEYQSAVLSRLNEPPVLSGHPIKGDRYLVTAGAASATPWVGKENYIAFYDGVTWQFVAPKAGMITWSVLDSAYYIYNGSAWTELTAHAQNTDIILNKANAINAAVLRLIEYDSGEYEYINVSHDEGPAPVTRYFAQTITAPDDGSLKKVQLFMDFRDVLPGTGDDDWQLEIRTCELDGSPSNTVLATSDIINTTSVFNGDVFSFGTFTKFTFSTPSTLVKDDKYAVVVKLVKNVINNGHGSIHTNKIYYNTSAYSGGTWYEGDDTGASGSYSDTGNDILLILEMDVSLLDIINNGVLKNDLTVSSGVKIGGNIIEDITDSVTKRHTQGTDQGLDTGGPNASTAADVADAVSKRHDPAGQFNQAGVGEIDGLAEKTTPIGTDEILIEDSEDSFNKKKVKLANIKSTSKVFSFFVS